MLISIHALRAEGDDSRSRNASCGSNFYPRPPCGGRPYISAGEARYRNFYPRPPCGGRPLKLSGGGRAIIFLSTPSVRRATLAYLCKWRKLRYFYPRPPCGGRRTSWHRRWAAQRFLSTPSVRRATDFVFLLPARYHISIHALRAEGDRLDCDSGFRMNISIHALRAEGDFRQSSACAARGYFYPRPPCGGRRVRPMLSWMGWYFYPRPPCGGRPKI